MMGEACSTYRRKEQFIKELRRELQEDHLVNIRAVVRILEWILKTADGRAYVHCIELA
jgi:hypothetical protein